MDPIRAFINDHREYSLIMSDFATNYDDFSKACDRSSLIKIRNNVYLQKLEMELHFSKEEYSLFSSVAHPVITLLIQEHSIMRSKLWEIDSALTALVNNEDYANKEKNARLKKQIREFRDFKEEHVRKEEKILFPYVQTTFSTKDMEAVVNKFKDFDTIVAANLL